MGKIKTDHNCGPDIVPEKKLSLNDRRLKNPDMTCQKCGYNPIVISKVPAPWRGQAECPRCNFYERF